MKRAKRKLPLTLVDEDDEEEEVVVIEKKPQNVSVDDDGKTISFSKMNCQYWALQDGSVTTISYSRTIE